MELGGDTAETATNGQLGRFELAQGRWQLLALLLTLGVVTKRVGVGFLWFVSLGSNGKGWFKKASLVVVRRLWLSRPASA